MSRAERNRQAVKYHLQHPEVHNAFIVEQSIQEEKARRERVKQIDTLFSKIHDITYDRGRSLATVDNPYHPVITLKTENFRTTVYKDLPQIKVAAKKDNEKPHQIVRFPSGIVQILLFNTAVFPEIRQKPTTPVLLFSIDNEGSHDERVTLETFPEFLPIGHQNFVIDTLSKGLTEIENETKPREIDPWFELVR